MLSISHWILQFSFNWYLVPLSLLLHHIVLGFGSKFKWIWGSTSLVQKGSGASSREGIPCFFSLTRAHGFMIKNIVKNWVILTSTPISRHCPVHCTPNLSWCEYYNNTAPLNSKISLELKNGVQSLPKLKSCAHIISQSSGSLGTMCATLRWCTEAPSHVTAHILPLLFYSLFFLPI